QEVRLRWEAGFPNLGCKRPGCGAATMRGLANAAEPSASLGRQELTCETPSLRRVADGARAVPFPRFVQRHRDPAIPQVATARLMILLSVLGDEDGERSALLRRRRISPCDSFRR